MFTSTENGTYRGIIQFFQIILPGGCVGNNQIAAGAAIDAGKLTHQPRVGYSQESATTAAADTRVIAIARAAGTLKGFSAGSVVANIGDSTFTVDLLKNGVSILTAPITIDSGDAAYALVAGAIDTVGVVADDVLEVAVTVSAGTGTLGLGVFAELLLDEAAG